VRTLPTAIVAAALLLALPLRAAEYWLYAGTFTDPPSTSKGIYLYRFETATGKLSPRGVAAETPNPAFLAVHPNRKFLYAVNEGGGNTVTAFEIDDKTGKLTVINQVSALGDRPCYLAIDHTGRWMVVTNFADGKITEIPVAANGRLGEPRSLPQHTGAETHAHEAVFTADNRYLLVSDLGLDRIFIYRFDPQSGALTPAEPESASVASGAGVRHIAFHPNGRVLYALNETNSTVTAFGWDGAKGTLREFQSVATLPADFKGQNTTAEITVNRAGTVLYASNRGKDSIAMFDIDPQRFTLLPAGQVPTLGKGPRHFTLDPSGRYLLAGNQGSDTIVTFAVHARTGQLTPLREIMKDTPRPVCLLFVRR
jgi:6-phosphogluconolactonase